jgi:hypothetical protein
MQIIGYRLNNKESGSIPSRGKRLFSLLHCIQTAWGHPASYPKGTGDSFPKSYISTPPFASDMMLS